MTDKPLPDDDDQVHADLLEARRLIEAEIALLTENFPTQLVQYVVITAAIRLGWELEQSPGDFCKKVAQVVGLYCGEKPGSGPLVQVIELPEGE